jgi:hypothetical protein
MQVVAPYQRSGAGKIASATRWAPALVHGMVSIGGPIERRAAVTLSFSPSQCPFSGGAPVDGRSAESLVLPDRACPLEDQVWAAMKRPGGRS